MELSKEVHGLLDRIKRLSNAQRPTVEDTYYPFDMHSTYSTLEDIEYTPDDLIPLEDIDLSDKETWLFVSEGSSKNTNTSGLVHRDIGRFSEGDACSDLEIDKYGFKKNVDTRTFTRPKKRIIRPTLESISDSNDLFNSPRNKTNGFSDDIKEVEQIKIPENPFNNTFLKKDGSISTGPLHFKLSDPVLNHSFERILLTASDGYDSFQNMEPPSLMNSLCSSSFMDTSLIQNTSNSILVSDISSKSNISDDKSDYLSNEVSQESLSEYLAPLKSFNDKNIDSSNKLDSTVVLSTSQNRIQTLLPAEKSIEDNMSSNNLTFIEDKISDRNQLTSTPNKTSMITPKKLVIPTMSPKLNTTYGTESRNDISNRRNSLTLKNDENKLNSTFNTINKSKLSEKSLNSTFTQLNKTDSENSLNSTFTRNKLNTFLKKPRNITNLPESFKLSCPDINRTFQTTLDKSLNKTYQKLSDSQPNLTKDVQQTILNQSMELRNSNTYEGYRNSKCGSTDSLDEKSSSISNSSKESTSKVLNMGDLDNLARLQEQSLHQIMSTPKPKTSMSRFWDSEAMSPIPRAEEYLSEDSDFTDFSDQCVTARSRSSRPSTGSASSRTEPKRLPQVPKQEIKRPAPAGYVSRSQEVKQTVKNVPTMVVKPLEVTQTFKVPEKPVGQVSSQISQQRPRVRPSGLPRPTSALQTGIPRPVSRIPAPRFNRPQLTRPTTRPAQKTNWMDGCY